MISETGAIGWIELSPAALRRMRQELAVEGENTVDDMGVLALHVGYADKFFPGTSVLHTRPRYLFFTCWNLLYPKKYGTTTASFASEKAACEMWVTKQLRLTGEKDPTQRQDGIIGGRVYPNAPAQPPDFAYWTALRTFGFYRGVNRLVLALKWDPSRIERVSTVVAISDKDDQLAEGPGVNVSVGWEEFRSDPPGMQGTQQAVATGLRRILPCRSGRTDRGKIVWSAPIRRAANPL